MQQLLNIAEISVTYKPNSADSPIIKSSHEAANIARYFFPEETIALQERFIVILLNTCNRVTGVYPVSVGGINATSADVRLILSVALKAVATSIIIVHNHPTGNMKPSNPDITLTKKIKEGAELMDIKVIDHLILSPDKDVYYSFADMGLI